MNLAEKPFYPFMSGIGEKDLRRSFFNDLPLIHQDRPHYLRSASSNACHIVSVFSLPLVFIESLLALRLIN